MADENRVFSVDEALKTQTPKIEFRGELYEIREFSVEERLQLLNQYRKREEELLEAEEPDEEQAMETLRDLMAEAVMKALKDFPEEEANSLSQREFDAIQRAVNQARNQSVEPVEKAAEGKN